MYMANNFELQTTPYDVISYADSNLVMLKKWLVLRSPVKIAAQITVG